jgi:hypothetical protein
MMAEVVNCPKCGKSLDDLNDLRSCIQCGEPLLEDIRALGFSKRARFAQSALVNGAVGVVVAPRGRLLVVLRFTIDGGKITEIDVIADPARLRQLDLAVLDDWR